MRVLVSTAGPANPQRVSPITRIDRPVELQLRDRPVSGNSDRSAVYDALPAQPAIARKVIV
jgi:hypothetical protein